MLGGNLTGENNVLMKSTLFPIVWLPCKVVRKQMECRYAGVDRKNYQLIEHLLRKGTRQLNLLKESHIAAIHQ